MPDMNKIELNNEIGVKLNTTPSGETKTMSDMTLAFKNIGMAINEVIYSASYLADGGFSSSAVVGAAPTITLTGDYMEGDAVCEYLDSKQYEIGSERVTEIELTRAGKAITCPVTITGIAIAGGDSTAPNSITATIAFNGKPTISEESA